jgi:hypothetical protein
MLLRLTKTQVKRLKSEVLNDLANNRCSSENLRISCLEELTRRAVAVGRSLASKPMVAGTSAASTSVAVR